MQQRRTDLALEAKELWEESSGKTTQLSGVVAREEDIGNYHIVRVEILDEEGEEALGKPRGRYITLEAPGLCTAGRSDYFTAAEALAGQLTPLLPEASKAPILVVGLGNRHMSADAIGPLSLESILVTRHLITQAPEHFAHFRPVCAIAPGVMGDTGLESGELIAALVQELSPCCVIAVDALASRSAQRLFQSIQIADTGIKPGSGVGNHRMSLDAETLGIPVIALGVPTVVDAGTLCLDLLEKSGHPEFDHRPLLEAGADLFVTTRDVDQAGETLAKVLGLGISLALHVDLSVEDVEMFLS